MLRDSTSFTMTDKEIETWLAPRFAVLGMKDKFLKEVIKNKKIASAWLQILEEAGISGVECGLDLRIGVALSSLVAATKDLGPLDGRRAFVAKEIRNGCLKTAAQVDAAVKYIREHKDGIDESQFKKECGVGRLNPRCKGFSCSPCKALSLPPKPPPKP